MYILAIDTSSNMLTVSLSDNTHFLSEITCDKRMGLLEYLAPTVENILSENNISINELDCIAISLGPGSFTGLRIGMSFAKTLAYSLNIPIVGIPTLKAMAKNAENPFCDLICPMIFARTDEIYCAVFSGDLKNQYIDYTFMTISELLENPLFNNKKITFLGSGAIKHKEYIKEKFQSSFICDENYDFPKGTSLISLAKEEYDCGNIQNVSQLVPMYIKKPTPVIRMMNKKNNI